MKLDPHIHTNKSYDSLQTPKQVGKKARKLDVDAIAITDHNEFGAHGEVRKYSGSTIVVPGMEVRTEDYGDLLAIGISSEISSREFENVAEETHSKGGAVILPHPYRKIKNYPDDLENIIDCVESINSRSKKRKNEMARRLSNELGIPATGGSDSHTPWEVGRAGTVIPDDCSNSSQIVDALRSGDTSSYGDESSYYVNHGISLMMEAIKKLA